MHKELLWAVSNRNTAEALNIINKLRSEELDTTDSYESTVFHYAIKYNINNKNEKIFHLLVEKMSVVGLCNKSNDFKGKTVLHMLAEAALDKICIEFINKVGKDGVEITDNEKVTALHYAAKSGLNKVCKIIISMLSERELEYKDSCGNLALHLAITSELNEIAILLLIPRMKRADIEHPNDYHYTPLQYAAKLGLLDVCVALVEQMSQKGIEYKSAFGKPDPALSLAAYEKHVEICKLLALHMSIPAIKDCNYQYTNLLKFLKSNSHSKEDKEIAEIIEARIQGKDVNLINCDQFITSKPLLSNSYISTDTTVSQLSKFQQLISLVKASNTEEAIKLITRMKSNELKEVDEDGRTVLHWISETNNAKLLNVVLKKLPSLVGVEDYYENTPLTLAEIYNSELCIDLLKSFTGAAQYNHDQTNESTSLGGNVIHHD